MLARYHIDNNSFSLHILIARTVVDINISNEIDIRGLALLYQESPPIKEIVDWLNDRERDPRNSYTRVTSLRVNLYKRGQEFSTDDLREALGKIVDSGWGEFSHGESYTSASAIHWKYPARKIAKMVLEEVARGVGSNTSATEEDNFETHYFPMRLGKQLKISIPMDMTSKELENMSEFVRIIAKSRVRDGEGT